MAKRQAVPRPVKKSEYTLCFASTNAQRGWRDLEATRRNSLVDAWDFLTRTPLQVTPTNYPLKGDLGVVVRMGVEHQRCSTSRVVATVRGSGSTSLTKSSTSNRFTPATPTRRSNRRRSGARPLGGGRSGRGARTAGDTRPDRADRRRAHR